MKNHGLGTHNEKMCAIISTGNTPNTPPNIFGPFASYLGYFRKKSLHHMSIVHALDKTFAVRKFVAFRQKCQAFSEHLEDMTSII